MLGTMSFPTRKHEKHVGIYLQLEQGMQQLLLISTVIFKESYLFWTGDVASIRQHKAAELVEVLNCPLSPLRGLQQADPFVRES